MTKTETSPADLDSSHSYDIRNNKLTYLFTTEQSSGQEGKDFSSKNETKGRQYQHSGSRLAPGKLQKKSS